jgi:hypothetical protein
LVSEEEEGLIEQILRAQKVKAELDQEMETYEDDLSELCRIVETKQTYSS